MRKSIDESHNWLPETVPAAGDVLTFVSSAPNFFMESNDDLSPGLVIGGLRLSEFTVRGNPVTLDGDVDLSIQWEGRHSELDLPITLARPVSVFGRGQLLSMPRLRSS